jgi:hypothetical protein
MDEEQEWLRDPVMLRDVARRRALRAMVSAAGVLGRIARGGQFLSESQREACCLLMKLAPSLLGGKHNPPSEPLRSLCHPSVPPDRELRLLIMMESKCDAREQSVRKWGEYFDEFGPSPGEFETLDEALSFGGNHWDQMQERIRECQTSRQERYRELGSNH